MKCQPNVGLVSVCILAMTPSGAKAQEEEEGVFLGTVVLGERIERSLEDTFVGATVIEEDQIAREPQVHVNDVLIATPNVFVEGKSELPSIRGIQGGGPGGVVSANLTGALPRLSFVIDGVTRPAVLPNSSGSSLWDVSQIEVLRGPQSLLRGRSALAGAIIIDTNDPTFEPEAALQFGIEADDFHGTNAMLNAMASGPISETVAARFTFEAQDGADPRRASDVEDDWIVDYDDLRLRAKILGEFETGLGPLTVNLLGEHQWGQTPQTRNTVQTERLTGRALSDRILDNAAAGTFGIPARTFDTQTNVMSLDTELELTTGTLQLVLFYVEDEYESIPEQVYPFPFDVDEKISAQEIVYRFGNEDRLLDGELSGIAGLSFEQREQRTDISGLFRFESDVETSSQAVFSEFRYGISDRLTVFGGARWLNYKDERDQLSVSGSIAGAQDYSETETELLPTLGLACYFDDTTVLNASVRRGYNPGGSSVNIFEGSPYTYESETVTAYEITYRRTWEDAGVNLGVTAFYNDHDNPQLYAELEPGDRSSLQVVNQQEGESYGLEIEGAWRATEQLNLNAAIGFLEAEVTEPQENNPDLRGNSFGQDPAVTLTLGAVYQVSDAVSLDGRATYRGVSYNDFNNISDEEVGDYWIVDIGATALVGRYEIRGYVENLFDEMGVTRFVSDKTYADVTDPLSVGLTATARW